MPLHRFSEEDEVNIGTDWWSRGGLRFGSTPFGQSWRHTYLIAHAIAITNEISQQQFVRLPKARNT